MSSNTALSPSDTEAVTRLTTNSHRVKWTIENVKHYPESAEIVGPNFCCLTTCKGYISISKRGIVPRICLHNTSEKAINVKSDLVLFNSRGTKLLETNMKLRAVEKDKHIVLMDISIDEYADRLGSLIDDKLIIDCKLTAIGYYTEILQYGKGYK